MIVREFIRKNPSFTQIFIIHGIGTIENGNFLTFREDLKKDIKTYQPTWEFNFLEKNLGKSLSMTKQKGSSEPFTIKSDTS